MGVRKGFLSHNPLVRRSIEEHCMVIALVHAARHNFIGYPYTCFITVIFNTVLRHFPQQSYDFA